MVADGRLQRRPLPSVADASMSARDIASVQSPAVRTEPDHPDLHQLYAKIDGQVVERDGQPCRVQVFSIYRDEDRVWMQFALIGREPYMATICIAACDLDRLVSDIGAQIQNSASVVARTTCNHHR